MQELGLRGCEPVGDASSEREDLCHPDRERRARGQVAELCLDVRAEVRRERVEQRDVRPNRRTAPWKESSVRSALKRSCAWSSNCSVTTSGR